MWRPLKRKKLGPNPKRGKEGGRRWEEAECGRQALSFFKPSSYFRRREEGGGGLGREKGENQDAGINRNVGNPSIIGGGEKNPRCPFSLEKKRKGKRNKCLSLLSDEAGRYRPCCERQRAGCWSKKRRDFSYPGKTA